MTGSAPDDGFILVDALAAATILALAGTVVLLIGNSAMSRAANDLDRSVALLRLDGLAAEIRLVGVAATSVSFPFEESGMRFELATEARATFPTLSVHSVAGGETPSIVLDVAAPLTLSDGETQ